MNNEPTSSRSSGQAAETAEPRNDDLPSTREGAMSDEGATPVPERPRSGEPLLFPREEGDRFRSRWSEIQTDFVDRPREAVEEADKLVAEVMERLAAEFGEKRSRLESQWDETDDVSTEDLRVALTRYRSFFERLLAA